MTSNASIGSFFDWWAGRQENNCPWLIFGKGPSFSKRDQYDLRLYKTLSLNHAVREQYVDVAHIIDIDVVTACAEALLSNAGILVMPWYPHINNAVGKRTLAEWAGEIPTLARLASLQRLYWYDLRTSPIRHGSYPIVHATYFSAEAALNLLALAGVKTVRSLGVDGGDQYSASFDDLKNVTRLNNGHATYDLQFQGFANTISQTGVDFAPLDEAAPVEIFVGSEDAQMLAVRVLEYSIRRHASQTVRVRPLHQCGLEFPRPKDSKNAPRTPFSFQRFGIPKLCGYRGRAIYFDSDMLVFRDIRELWRFPMAGAEIQAVTEPRSSNRKPQFSVMLMDCQKLSDWTPEGIVARLDSGEFTYERLMFDMAAARDVRSDLPERWNSLERYRQGETALLHYTDMNQQPWVTHRNPNGRLWLAALVTAVNSGYIKQAEIEEHVRRGWIRPSLLKYVERGSVSLGLSTPLIPFIDRKFIPPYKKL